MITENTTPQKLGRLRNNVREWVLGNENDPVTIEELKKFTFPDAGVLLTWWEVMCNEWEKEHGDERPHTMNRDHFEICLHHSALVPWLLAGNDPLPEPPPRSFSRPWHDLIAKGWGCPMEVWVNKNFPETLGVDQERWKLLEVISEDVFLGQWYDDDRWIFVGVKDETAFTKKSWVAKRL